MNSTHTHTQKHRHNQWEWRPWDLLMLFAAAVLWIHKRPCGAPGKNGVLDTPFVKNGLKMCRRTSDVSLVSKWDSSMNMYCMLIPHAWLKLLMKTEDTFPHLHSGEEVLSTNLLSAQPHPWARGQSGDRWQISVTAAKVTLQDGLWGPTGDWSSAGVCSFYCHLDLLWLYTGWLD